MLASYVNYNHIDVHSTQNTNAESSGFSTANPRLTIDSDSSQRNSLGNSNLHGVSNDSGNLSTSGTNSVITHPPLCSSLVTNAGQNESSVRASSNLYSSTMVNNESVFLPRSVIAGLNTHECSIPSKPVPFLLVRFRLLY